MTEGGKYGDNCFHDNRDDPDPVAMNTLVFSFPGNQLIEADNFTFTLTMSAPNKTSQSVFQVIHLVDKVQEMAKYDCCYYLFEPVREKTKNMGSDEVRHKPGYTVTEDG